MTKQPNPSVLHQQYEYTEDFCNAMIQLLDHNSVESMQPFQTSISRLQDHYQKLLLEEESAAHVECTQRVLQSLSTLLHYPNGIPTSSSDTTTTVLVALTTLRASIQRRIGNSKHK